MDYKILEVHIVMAGEELAEIAVLWESNSAGWVRATHCTIKPCQGYKFITPFDKLSPSLIQEVAGQGMSLPDNKKKKYFPGKRIWER